MARERIVPVDETLVQEGTGLKGKRGCPKGGWPKKANIGGGEMVEYRVIKAPTKSFQPPMTSKSTKAPMITEPTEPIELTTPRRKRGCPKGGWPKKVERGEQGGEEEVMEEIEEVEEVE